MAARPASPERREELLRVAAALFAEHGFRGVGVDQIGAAAGISGPGVYRHFPSKDAMLAEMLVRISEQLLTEGTRRVRTAGDPDGALAALVGWHVEFALSNPELITVHDRDLSSLPPAEQRTVRRLQRRYVEQWVTVIRQVRPLSDDGARAAAHAVFGLLNSTPHFTGALDREAAATLLRRMALAALHGC